LLLIVPEKRETSWLTMVYQAKVSNKKRELNMQTYNSGSKIFKADSRDVDAIDANIAY
jgi:hypothetical protein